MNLLNYIERNSSVFENICMVGHPNHPLPAGRYHVKLVGQGGFFQIYSIANSEFLYRSEFKGSPVEGFVTGFDFELKSPDCVELHVRKDQANSEPCKVYLFDLYTVD